MIPLPLLSVTLTQGIDWRLEIMSSMSVSHRSLSCHCWLDKRLCSKVHIFFIAISNYVVLFVRWVICIQVEMFLPVLKSLCYHLVIKCCSLGLIVPVYNPTTQEAGSGGLP